MKRLFLLLMVTCCLVGSINAQSHRGSRSHSTATKRATTTTPAFKVSNAKWSKTINLNQDLSKLSYEDLYYLRALVYATHGKWFTDGEIAQMLASKAEWYTDLMYKRVSDFYNKHSYDDSEAFDKFLEGTALTQAEKAFVAKIDSRMKSLETTTMSGRTLESPKLCINMCQLVKPSADILSKLDKYNFAIEQTDCEQLFNIYEQNDYCMMPSFVTTDAYLQVAHMYLAYAQKYIEQNFFSQSLEKTLTALYQQAVKDAANSAGEVKARAGFVATYAAVGITLLTNKSVDLPAEYQDLYKAELANIEECVNCPSPLLNTEFDFSYSLFRPRGHYTRSEEQKQFFKAMMWVQYARFESNNASQMKNAFTLATIYNEITSSQQKDFEHMSDVITQLTGPSDNVSILQMADYLKQNNITSLSAIDDENTYNKLVEAMKALNDKQNFLSNNAEAMTGFYINMMPQRFLVDNEVLRNIVDEKANAELPFPRGLHVFEAFGSKTADDLVYNFYKDNTKWADFNKNMGEMKNKYANKPVGFGTIYDRRLDILVNLSKEHPQALEYSFYNTSDWQRKELNTALSSWATLKHDAILYAEQPEVAECGSGEELPPPMPMGFVEPNVRFWNELTLLISDTKEWLKKSGYLDEELEGKTDNFLDNITFCKDVAEKEAKGEAPNREDLEEIKTIGSTLEWMTLGLIDPTLELMSWDDMKGADRSIAQVADIFTRNVPGCNKNGILYSACGNANAIYVLVKVNGKTYLTRGATYGYYEFTLPVDKPRLTDEEWQKELKKGIFTMPKWMEPYIINGKTKVDERNFYGSGC